MTLGCSLRLLRETLGQCALQDTDGNGRLRVVVQGVARRGTRCWLFWRSRLQRSLSRPRRNFQVRCAFKHRLFAFSLNRLQRWSLVIGRKARQRGLCDKPVFIKRASTARSPRQIPNQLPPSDTLVSHSDVTFMPILGPIGGKIVAGSKKSARCCR